MRQFLSKVTILGCKLILILYFYIEQILEINCAVLFSSIRRPTLSHYFVLNEMEPGFRDHKRSETAQNITSNFYNLYKTKERPLSLAAAFRDYLLVSDSLGKKL